MSASRPTRLPARLVLALALAGPVACDDKKEDAGAKKDDGKDKGGKGKDDGGKTAAADGKGDAGAAKPEAPARPNFPAGMEGAKQVLAPFAAAGADFPALTNALKPEDADYAAVFEGDAAAKAKTAYAGMWGGGLVLGHKPDQTELQIWEATTEQLHNEPKGNVLKTDAKYFPGGYSKAVPSMKKGLTWYRFKFTKPGEELGMGYDGLVHVNGHWAVFPKPWRALGLESTEEMEKMFDNMSPYDMGKMLAEKK